MPPAAASMSSCRSAVGDLASLTTALTARARGATGRMRIARRPFASADPRSSRFLARAVPPVRRPRVCRGRIAPDRAPRSHLHVFPRAPRHQTQLNARNRQERSSPLGAGGGHCQPLVENLSAASSAQHAPRRSLASMHGGPPAARTVCCSEVLLCAQTFSARSLSCIARSKHARQIAHAILCHRSR